MSADDTNRKIIRQQAKASILHCANFAGNNVFTSRSRKLDSHELPAILIYTPDEKVSVFNSSPLEYRRTCTLKIEIAAEGGDDIEDTLDDYAKLVEGALGLHDTLNDSVDYVILLSVESEVTADGEKIAGGIALTYEVVYNTTPVNEGDDEAHDPLVPFITAHTNYEIAGSLDDSPATGDTVTLQQ